MMSYIGRSAGRIRDWIQSFSFWILLLVVFVVMPLMATYFYNLPGPSTYYFDQHVVSAKPGPDGKHEYVYPGDELLVHASTIRHRFNGQCELAVWRVRETIGGPYDGNIHLMQFVWQAFVGESFFRRTSWPIAPEKVIVDKTNIVEKTNGDMVEQDGTWFDDPTADQQAMDIFVIGRYYCNFLDYIEPRFLEDNDGPPEKDNQRGRGRRTVGFVIPDWNSAAGFYEGGHSRVILKKTPPQQ